MLTHVRYMKMEGYIYEIYKAKYYLFYSQTSGGVWNIKGTWSKTTSAAE